ncbi:hypothetical protein [Nocardiopsis rhodophaea]|uniref:hypothetical protein n=1 Tax=Nocardiopsis rhodophaea TaxID=280238 RepID=UPI0031E493C9
MSGWVWLGASGPMTRAPSDGTAVFVVSRAAYGGQRVVGAVRHSASVALLTADVEYLV